MSSHPIIKDWHSPNNEKCPQNNDVDADCECKRKRHFKPYRTVRVKDEKPPHNVRANLVIEVHPHGLIVIRELACRRRYCTTAGKLIEGLIWRDAMQAARARKQKKLRK